MRKIYLIFTVLVLVFSGCMTGGITAAKLKPGDIDSTAEKKPEYPDYWTAMDNLCPEYVSDNKCSEEEKQFASALAFLIDREFSNAEPILIELADNAEDIKIRERSEMYLSELYFFLERWDSMLVRELRNYIDPEFDNAVLARYSVYSNAPVSEIIFPDSAEEVPIKLTIMGNPVIEVRINGVKKFFWIDTGASMSVVSSDTAEQCGIMNTMDIAGKAGTATTNKIDYGPAVVDTLEFGGLVLKNHRAIILDKEALEFKLFGIFTVFRIDGIIGWNAISRIRTEIDFKNKKALFSKPVTAGDTHSNLFFMKQPMIKAHSPDGIELNVMLDTGAAYTSVSDNVLEKLLLEGKGGSAKSWGAGGSVNLDVKVLKDFSFYINDYLFSIDKIETMVLNNNWPVLLDVRLGVDMFRKGRIILDYQNGYFNFEET